MVKTNTEGITWAISHDHTAYVYSGGDGGGIFKGTVIASLFNSYMYLKEKPHVCRGCRYLINTHGLTLFSGISGVNHAVYPQTDTRQMCIYENQKWHLLTGFSSR